MSLPKDYTKIQLGKRATSARVEEFIIGGKTRYHIRTKGGLTVGGKLYDTVEEAVAELQKLGGILRMPVNDKIFHATIRHQIYLERYKAGVFRGVVPILKATMLDIENKIAALPENATRARLEQVLFQIQKSSMLMSGKVNDHLKKELDSLATQEAAITASNMDSAIPNAINVTIGLPTVSTLSKIVATEPFQGLVLEEWTKRVGLSHATKARQQLYIGLAEGESIPKITKRFKFIESQTTRDLEMVVRTSINHVANQAKSSVYSANADILDGVMWRATLDGRTSDICASRDGKQYPVDDHPTPPAHPNCRSVLVPIVKSYKEFGFDDSSLPEGTRASMNGQVPTSETYSSWLRKQPREFIEETLGKSKAQIFIDQKLTLDKFVDTSGKSLTLEQLNAKYI